jgi:xanthine dehydrogenase molybdenum-binding subunit
MTLGESVRRVDAAAKVTGRARYTDDYFMPGMLTAKYVRSNIAHGKVTKIDTEKAKALPGVEAVFTYQDIPQIKYAPAGHPFSLDPSHQDVADMMMLSDEVKYIGDEIAVVVAENEIIAQQAVELVAVEYETYEVFTSPDQVLAKGAREIHAGSGNIAGKNRYEVGGNLEEAFAVSDMIHEGEYSTAMVQHLHIENHTAFAYMNDLNHLVIVSSTQIPHIVRRVVGQALDLPWGNIRVKKPYIGGGFGNKQDVVLEPMVAFLSYKLDGRPVKITMSREECMLNTRNRHPMELKLKMGVTKDGTMKGRSIKLISNTGAYASHGHAIAAAGGSKSCLLYPNQTLAYDAKTVYTNIPIGGAMRAYGSPQIIFAIESAVDDMARKLSMDPVDFRVRNAAKTGDINPLNKKAISSSGLIECLEKGRKAIDWDQKMGDIGKSQTGPIRQGLGVACFSYGTGTYPVCVEIAGARIILNQDGSVHVQTGATEIGQGSDTAVAQMVAGTMGISFEKVHVVSTQDTDVTPFDTGAYASRQVYVVGNAVFKASRELREKILYFAAELTETPSENLDIVDDNIVTLDQNAKQIISLADLSIQAYYHKVIGGQLTADISYKTTTNAPAFGCTFVDINVDIPLCRVTINEIINIHDSGKIINPQMARGQVEGGVAMGIAAALSEQMLIEPKSGKVYNNNMLDYKVPTMTDVPDIGSDFVETEEPTSSYKTKSLGEPPIISPPPAIRNAILHATGVAINELPMTPQVIFEHFKKHGLI